MKKLIYLFLLVLFLIPFGVKADDTTKQFYINIDVLENGDILVKELATLSGEYNGRFRDINYKSSNSKTFDGSIDSFYQSDIYNGSAITNLKIGRLNSDNNKISWDSFNNSYTLFDNEEAMVGDYGKYLITQTDIGISTQTFMPSEYNGIFYIEYIIKDAVVVHNDIAEINWNIFDESNEENIEDFQVRIMLPNKDPDLRVWLKGNKNTLNGEIRKTSEQQANIYFDFLGMHNPITFRLMFSKDQVPYAIKKSNVDGKDKILEVEKNNAKQANIWRNQIKKQVKLVKAVNIVWLILFFITIIIYYFKYDKEYKPEFNLEYMRELPEELPPEQVTYIMTKNISNNSFSASICNMIYKKVLKVQDDPNGDKNYIIIGDDSKLELLTEEEKMIYDLLIKVIGNEKSVTTKELTSYGTKETNATKFMSKYSLWKSKVSTKCEELNIYEKPKIKIVLFMLILLFGSYGILTLDINFDLWIGIGFLILVLGIIGFIYILLAKKRTKTGNEEYSKWKAFEKFLKDFGRFNEKELPEIVLWEKYLVYATALGCAKQVQKSMSIKLKELYPNGLDQNNPTYMDYYMMNRMIDMDMSNTILNSVTTAVSASRSSIARSSSSSGGGFGGGSSFGGGSGGGGGGSGRF